MAKYFAVLAVAVLLAGCGGGGGGGGGPVPTPTPATDWELYRDNVVATASHYGAAGEASTPPNRHVTLVIPPTHLGGGTISLDWTDGTDSIRCECESRPLPIHWVSYVDLENLLYTWPSW